VKDPANRLDGGLKIHKMVHVPPSNKKKNGAMRKCRVYAKHKMRKKKQVSFVQAVVGLSANFHVSTFITQRKIIKKV
jgi:hypothetical protein